MFVVKRKKKWRGSTSAYTEIDFSFTLDKNALKYSRWNEIGYRNKLVFKDKKM